MVEGEWPDGVFSDDAPEVVAYAVEVSRLLGAAMVGVNKSRLAQEAEVDRATLYALLGGTTWADMVTLGKLERVLRVSLWPQDPPALRRKADD